MRESSTRHAEKSTIRVGHKDKDGWWSRPQGNRIQRRAVARVIRDNARWKGHLQNGTRIRVTCGDPTARQQVSASGASQSQTITPRRREYARNETSNSRRAVQTYTAASGDSIRNAPDELVLSTYFSTSVVKQRFFSDERWPNWFLVIFQRLF